MVGVALSRWTMSYFATALLALIVAEGLMLAGIGYPHAPIAAPEYGAMNCSGAGSEAPATTTVV